MKGLIFLSLVVLVFPAFVVAKSPEFFNLTPQKTLPGSFFYPLKRLKEKIKMKFLFSLDKKIKYKATLLEKRLAELAGVIDKEEISHISDSTQRFAYEAGILADLVQKDKKLKDFVFSYFDNYQPILAELRDRYPANSAYWLLIQQDIDTIKILTDKLK